VAGHAAMVVAESVEVLVEALVVKQAAMKELVVPMVWAATAVATAAVVVDWEVT